MSETLTDCSPLSQACIKALTDRIEEKRKYAASEVEKMTVDFSVSNNLTMINRLIIVLGRKFCLSSNPNTRKGGLIGLAAVMVGFKNGALNEPPADIVEEVVRPILTCFLDSDSRVRYYACESLYNVTKVARENILPLFESIFDNMSKIVADPDIGVRSGAEVLDRLLKDIVGQQEGENIAPILPKLEDYLYTKNAFTRMFIISWIRHLDELQFDMLSLLPQLLDGIFNCLCDSNDEIRGYTLALLSEFLHKIVVCPTDKINIGSLVSTLLKHARNDKEDVVQYNAVAWLRQFIDLMDEKDLLTFTPGILVAILPCLSIQSSSDSDSNVSTRGNQSYSQKKNYISQAHSRTNICEISTLVNSLLLEHVTIILSEKRSTHGSKYASNELEPILEVLIKELQKHDNQVIKLAVLDWMRKLKKAEPELILGTTLHQKLFQTLLETLPTSSNSVVKSVLRVIADIFCCDNSEEQQVVNTPDNISISAEDAVDFDKKKSPVRNQPILTRNSSSSTTKTVAIASGDAPTTQGSANIGRLIQALCKTFRDKKDVPEERIGFIVMNLCAMIKPDIVYKSFADILRDEKIDLKFAHDLVYKLNQILLTTQALYGLRSRLGNDDDPEMVTLFHSLYQAWCHSPIAVLTLCLLTNNYRHASEIVKALSQTDINVDILRQIDWVVQLIESPVFASLRMRLLDVNTNQYLLQSLYGILMILPQSGAYVKLGNRLDQAYKFISSQQSLKVPTTGLVTQHKPPQTNVKEAKKSTSITSLDTLMKHYFNIQNQHSRITRFNEFDK